MPFTPKPWPRRLRSQEWYAGMTKDAIYHRAWMKNQGFPADLFDGRPIIGVLNTWSQLNPCNAHLDQLAEKVKAGIWEAGGFPVEVPVFSVSESAFRPTAMMFRNLAAMAVEETIRGQPIDGCVLLVGCDKTTPSLLMGAASCDLPSIVVSGGPMLNGYWRNETVGSGTHLWRFSEAVRAGTMKPEEFVEAEASMSRSAGSCNTMGTASTMTSIAEALGLTMPGAASIPAAPSASAARSSGVMDAKLRRAIATLSSTSPARTTRRTESVPLLRCSRLRQQRGERNVPDIGFTATIQHVHNMFIGCLTIGADNHRLAGKQLGKTFEHVAQFFVLKRAPVHDDRAVAKNVENDFAGQTLRGLPRSGRRQRDVNFGLPLRE